MNRSYLACLLACALRIQPTSAQQAYNDPALQFGIQTQWELYQDVPINRVPFLGAHNSFANRTYTYNAGGQAVVGSLIAGGILLGTFLADHILVQIFADFGRQRQAFATRRLHFSDIGLGRFFLDDIFTQCNALITDKHLRAGD